jgi:tetratricopeptide (TPR) repeat protein
MDEYLPNEEILMKYLDEELTSQERVNLENLLKEDDELRKRLENLRLAKEAVRYYSIQSAVANVGAEWKHSHSVPEERPKAKVVSLKRVGLYALATACILFAVIRISLFFNSHLTPERVYQEAYVDYKPGSSRSAKQSGTSIILAYQQNNYQEVIRLSHNGNLTPQEQLITAIAYLKANKAADAVPYLEALQSNTTYHQDSEFYLALAYLKIRQFDKSLNLLKKIQSDPNHLYHQQVDEKIINEVENLR